MPPSQWSSERHMRMPGGLSSRPEITVEPVVVIAETDSKKALAKSISSDDSMKGTAPTSEKTSHSMLTSRKPIFLLNGGGPARVAAAVIVDRPPTSAAERTKTCQSGWP